MDECVGKYMQPIIANNGTFRDAVIAFQVAVGINHGVEANGFKSLYDNLPVNDYKVHLHPGGR